MPIRVLIADDHSMVRRGLRLILSLNADLQVVGEASDGNEAVRLSSELEPDVVLMDVNMPLLDGIKATAAIKEASPETQVVIVSSDVDEDSVMRAVRAGAVGYLLKSTPDTELCRAIRGAASGQPQLSPEAATFLMRGVRTAEAQAETLSGRERDVLRLLARGQSNKEIARVLGIGDKTVKTHVSNILAKLGCQSRTQAVMTASRLGLIN